MKVPVFQKEPTKRSHNLKLYTPNLQQQIDLTDDQADTMAYHNFLSPRVSNDGRTVEFAINVAGRVVKGQITMTALEQHFWLCPGAGTVSALRIFEDGRLRILAAAQRMALKHSASEIHLDVADFSR